MTATLEALDEQVFSEDPEINRLCNRRAKILLDMETTQSTPQGVLEELDDLNKTLEVFGL